LSTALSMSVFMLNVEGYLIFFESLRPKMSNRFIVAIKIRGAWLIEVRFVAFCFDLHEGHRYLLSLVSLSEEQSCFMASPKVATGVVLGKGKLKVNVSSKVSDL